MEKVSKVESRHYYPWTKANAAAYVSKVNVRGLTMGLRYWSATDFLNRVG